MFSIANKCLRENVNDTREFEHEEQMHSCNFFYLDLAIEQLNMMMKYRILMFLLIMHLEALVTSLLCLSMHQYTMAIIQSYWGQQLKMGLEKGFQQYSQ